MQKINIKNFYFSWWENKEKSDHFARTENKKHLKEIEKLIIKYQPTMLIVEHDVRFIKEIATKVIAKVIGVELIFIYIIPMVFCFLWIYLLEYRITSLEKKV